MSNSSLPEKSLPNLVIITGLSGSGMSSATNAFEDLGYLCVDNLPVSLLPTFSRLLLPNDEDKSTIERAALVMNIRDNHFLSEFPQQLEILSAQELQIFLLFFEAADEVLQRRFSETRRPHPADEGIGLMNAIQNERRTLEQIRELADFIIDTSLLSVHDLRRLIVEKFAPTNQGLPLRVQLLSFGHKYGSPHDIDLMFDVRHLPNPYFVPELREFSGSDKRIVNYLNAQAEVRETISRFEDLLEYLLPLYKREGKSYLTIGIGCTGGRHRSVMVANELARLLRKAGYDAQSTHRDSKKAAKKKIKAKQKVHSNQL
jgi:RNase adapter protein RapZ